LVERRRPTAQSPTHPGEMLLEEFLKPLGISQSAFAIQLGVSFPRLNEVVRGKRSVTPDTALRLARVTGMSADFWLGLQQDWDLWHALRSREAAEIARLKPLRRASRVACLLSADVQTFLQPSNSLDVGRGLTVVVPGVEDQAYVDEKYVTELPLLLRGVEFSLSLLDTARIHVVTAVTAVTAVNAALRVRRSGSSHRTSTTARCSMP